jgi:hypothetical protein
MRERWEIPKEVRRPAIERLVRIINDPEAGHREVIGAIRALRSASNINPSNISGSIKALDVADLDPRLTALARKNEEREAAKLDNPVITYPPKQ